MFLLLVKILLVIPVVSGLQSCYSSCDQEIRFNTSLQPPAHCTAHSNSSLLCAVSVTFDSNHEDRIKIFYFTPIASESRPLFVETQVSLPSGVLSLQYFHECSDCDILENTRNIIASIQSTPKLTSVVAARMREIFPIDNTTSKTIECYDGDDETETIGQCQSCSLEINSTSAIRPCKDRISAVGIKLDEKTTLDNKREFRTVHIECVQSKCNTRNTAIAALRVLADTGLAQHFYDLSSSAISFSYSIRCILLGVFIFVNIN